MIRVLFICWGNICRSPIAEFVMKDIVKKQGLEEGFHIESSAMHTDEIWNGIGNPIYPPARAKLREHGIGTDDNELGVSEKRARLTLKGDYDRFDFIIGMDGSNMRDMNRLFGGDPEKKVYKMLDFTDRDGDVADPWYTGNFDATWRDVSEGCHGLFRRILTDPKYAAELAEVAGESHSNYLDKSGHLRGNYGYHEIDGDFHDSGFDGITYDDFPRG